MWQPKLNGLHRDHPTALGISNNVFSKSGRNRLNPQAPVAQKTADEVVFRRVQGEGVEFFKIGPH